MAWLKPCPSERGSRFARITHPFAIVPRKNGAPVSCPRWADCKRFFIGAMQLIAGPQKIVLKDVSIDSSVSFGPVADGGKGFGIGVDMVIHLPGLEREQAEKLVHDAHEVCPYSNATRGNIDVNLSVA
ncbi:putative redox protein, regulator of disulfide bond formation [Terriglobus roseus DSM 18391]|uniref:Putative redox protein, regulator of disulfide bond formation n=2 Tax=Terriglobus roseus TaxID=392734 RepID=I3ZKX3_TERRK|nr:putative redox protein, regulator of disulfide bond formation [Terriglobus roseus DSM 18391]